MIAGLINAVIPQVNEDGLDQIKSVGTVFQWPCDSFDIPHYEALRVAKPLTIDGHLDEGAWKNVTKSSRFKDLVSGTKTMYNTQAAVLWDDHFLYVAYWVEEPFLQASLTERDAPIYKDNDVELFIAGKDAYYELEINTFGTIYEVLFIWEDAYLQGGYDQYPGLGADAPGRKVFYGVGLKAHPRNPRIGFWNWDLLGLQSAVHADGTINDRTDRDRGWTVEIAVPWSGLEVLAQGDQRSIPPRQGDIWRMDFSRFNQDRGARSGEDSGGWAWSPHGIWDSHVPECFTFIQFSNVEVGKAR